MSNPKRPSVHIVYPMPASVTLTVHIEFPDAEAAADPAEMQAVIEGITEQSRWLGRTRAELVLNVRPASMRATVLQRMRQELGGRFVTIQLA